MKKINITIETFRTLVNSVYLPLILKFAEIKGTKFISLPAYSNKFGEVANHVVNVNFNYTNLLKADLQTLLAFDCSKVNTYPLNEVEEQRNELIKSLENRLNGELNNLSLGQINAYESICNGLRVHKETKEFHIFAMGVSKTVLQAGNYPKVNHRKATVIKHEIRKIADLKSEKIKNFKVSSASKIALQKDTLVFQ